jgi:hypothetical protein
MYSIAEVQERVATLQARYSGRNTAIEQARKLFFLDHYNDTGNDSSGNDGGVNSWKAPRTSTPTVDANGAYRVTCSDYTDYVYAMRSMMGANLPIIRCYSDKATKPGDEKISNAEKICQAVLYNARYRSERDVMQDFYDQGFVSGWGCAYAYWDEELAEDYENEDSSWQDFPLVLKFMPPEYAYMSEGGKRGRWSEFIYSWKRPIRDIENEWNVKLKKTRAADKEKDGDSEIEYTDFWYWEGKALWHCVVAGEDWVKKPVDVSKWYKGIPYTMIPFLSTSSTDPEHMSESSLTAQRVNVELQEDLLSRVMTNITYNADPVTNIYSDGVPKDYEKGPGAVNQFNLGTKVEQVTGLNTSQDVYQMLSFASSAAQRSGLPSISFGQGMSGLSGYAISLMGQGGQMKSVIPMANIEAGLSVVFDKILDIFKRQSPDKYINAYGQNDRGTVFQVKIKGNDLKGLRVDVKLKPRVPQDEVARANRARLLKGTVSDYFIKDDVLDMQDPAGDTERQMQEQFEGSPLVKTMAIAKAGAQAGYPPELVSMFMQQMMGAMGMGGPPPGVGQRPGNSGPPPPQPGAAMAPTTPDEMAMAQQQAAAMGNVPSPENPPGAGSVGMSMGGQTGGGYS